MDNNYIKRLFHVCVTVENIEDALKFYVGVLGLKSIGSLRNEKSKGDVLGLPGEDIEINADHLEGSETKNATVIDLVQYIKPKPNTSRPPKDLNRLGITRMAFGVDDIDSVYTKLTARNDIDFLCKPTMLNAPGGGWLKVCTFIDPFGVTLELIESGQE
ncbi:VOC family protein [Secundilactobacillus folii]|uniref:Glyoxalase/bleomycin resistance/dioxygenase family protein n=1 Tax=Secundilactobacillus folii TaxID=2678357 RepID=A0A7X2XW41_9LACO|nr:VOC family protein [Secundilactobacillus folii]MTV82762.1 glyoxalase/bleomycin resistance/dioxygenase family protein [Secundilactobacillus folii]